MAAYVDMDSVQFENANSLRKYPFAEEASLKDKTGRELPADIVVDVHMVVPVAELDPGSEFSTENAYAMPIVRLSSAHVSRAMVSVCFKSIVGGVVHALSATISSSNFTPYVPYRLEKLAGSADVGGIVTFGDIKFQDVPETYFLEDAMVHPCCIAVFKPAMLKRFKDARSGESLSGNVELSFSGYIRSEHRDGAFKLSLNDGADVDLASECSKATVASACGATPIGSINGVRPDEDGNIVLWFH